MLHVSSFHLGYMAVWGACCLAALLMVARRPASYSITTRGYRRMLAAPWKLATFAAAMLALVVVAPYTGDPTWDYVDATFMSLLTFATAPWSVGTLYLFARGRAGPAQAFVAACAWMFSASWSYDLYVLLRDGDYPVTWLANIPAASVLYCAAGLLWSLEWRAGRGATFCFMEPGWPRGAEDSGFARIAWVALPFIVIGVASIAYFVVPTLLGEPR